MCQGCSSVRVKSNDFAKQLLTHLTPSTGESALCARVAQWTASAIPKRTRAVSNFHRKTQLDMRFV